MHGLEILLPLAALAARLPRRDVGLSLTLVVIGTTQIALASVHGWTGSLHPLFALVVLTPGATLAPRSLYAHRRGSRMSAFCRWVLSHKLAVISPDSSTVDASRPIIA